LSSPAEAKRRTSLWRRLASGRPPSLSWIATAGLGVVLVCMAIGRLGRGIGPILLPKEATFGEAILYDHAARILRGEALYQPLERPPYSVAAYTPVYYALAAALRAVAGPGFAKGRVLSLLSALVAAALIWRLTARRARSRWAGVFAAALFLTLGFPGRVPWFALYKADMLGVTLALGSIATLSGGRTTRRLVAAGTLAALAILTKQTFIAAGLAGTLWLAFEDRKRASVFAGTWIAIILAAAAVLEMTTRSFFANALFANAVPFRWDALLPNLAMLAQFQIVPLALAGLYVLDQSRAGRRPSRDLMVLYWVAGFLSVFGLARPGSNFNYWIELAASTSILATLAIWDRLGRRVGGWGWIRAALPSALLGANVAFILLGFRAAAVPVRSLIQAIPEPDPEFGRLVERVRTEPREVLADPPDVVVLADRPNLLELYFSAIRYSRGEWDPGPLVRRICRGEVGLVVLRYTLDSDARGIYQGYPYWPPPVLAALRERMVLQSEQAGRYVYAPLEGGGSSASAVCREPEASR
jgi:hypothetical protein